MNGKIWLKVTNWCLGCLAVLINQVDACKLSFTRKGRAGIEKSRFLTNLIWYTSKDQGFFSNKNPKNFHLPLINCKKKASRIFNDEQAIAEYSPAADEGGISTKPVFGCWKTMKTMFDDLNALLKSSLTDAVPYIKIDCKIYDCHHL